MSNAGRFAFSDLAGSGTAKNSDRTASLLAILSCAGITGGPDFPRNPTDCRLLIRCKEPVFGRKWDRTPLHRPKPDPFAPEYRKEQQKQRWPTERV
jgi:hypothetical protein